MEVPRRVHLRTQDGIHPLRGQRFDDTVVEHARGVHHRRHPPVLQQFGDRVPIGHVAGHHVDVGAQLGQLGRQLISARCGRAAAADQHQVSHALLGDQVASHLRAQAARAAGDQHRAVGRPAVRLVLRRHAREPRRQDLGAPDEQLRLHRSQSPCDRLGFGRNRVQVQQAEEARVLGLGGPHQSSDGGGGHVVTGHRASGDEHQAGFGGTFRAQPVLHRRQRAGHRRVDGFGDGAGFGCDRDEHHAAGHRAQIGCGADFDAGRAQGFRQPVDVGAQHGRRFVERLRRNRVPVDAEQGPPPSAGRVQLLAGHRPHGQRLDGGHRYAVGIGHGEPHRAVVGLAEPHSQLHRVPGVQRHAGPRERQPRLTVGDDGGRVQARVEQRRVQVESVGLHLLGQRDLGEGVLTSPPDRAQPAEDGAVVEPGVGEPVVAVVERNGVRVRGRPGGGVEVGLAAVDAEHAAGAGRPGLVLTAVGLGVDVDRTASRLIGRADPDLHPDAAVVGQDQRRDQGQLFDTGAPDFVTGAGDHLDQRRARHDRAAHDHVIGQPRVGLQRQPAREQGSVALGQLHR
ncbi:hypothetical protein GCM10027597_47980 [Saccharopolyspora tripterygii]